MQTLKEVFKQIINRDLNTFCEANEKGEHTSSTHYLGRAVVIGGDYLEVKKKFFVAEIIEEVLGELSSSASAAATKLRDQFNDMANKELFHMLPDDILATIFEFAWIGSDGVKVAKNISLVSRSFHNIVLGLPILWSRISSPEVSLKAATLYASRVTTPTISLQLYGTLPPEVLDPDDEPELDRVIGMYELAASTSSRIRKITLTLSEYDLPHLEEIKRTSSSLSFPFLDELVVDCRDHVGLEFQSLCDDWSMPSLKKLDLTEIVLGLRPGIASALEVCAFEAKTIVEDGSWDVDDVVAFLMTLTSLKALRIAATFNEVSHQESFSMETVTSLTLCLQNQRFARELSILDIFGFPAIESFKVEVGITDLGRLEDVLRGVGFIVPPTSVTDVTVAIEVEYEALGNRMPFSTIGEWCEMFGELRSLTVESQRGTSHGLLAFANSIDALQVVDLEGKLTTSGVSLVNIPLNWHHPYRNAVVQKNDVGRPGLMNLARYFDNIKYA